MVVGGGLTERYCRIDVNQGFSLYRVYIAGRWKTGQSIIVREKISIASKENTMKKTRKIIKIDEELCNGCGQCVPNCAEGSLQIINGKAKLVADKLCDGLGACLGFCPTGALVIEEREAEEFDEAAVEAFLAEEKQKSGGCPSARLHTFSVPPSLQQKGFPTALKDAEESDSLLSHWPIQIRLLPPQAPFLQNADLLVAADCTAIAARNFQESYLAGKVVAMGCPKFDDRELYVEKFAQIFSTSHLKSLTILIMEVPCCAAMNGIIKAALEKAQVELPTEQIIISLQGREISRQEWKKEQILPTIPHAMAG